MGLKLWKKGLDITPSDNDPIPFQKDYKKYDINMSIVGNESGHLDQVFAATLKKDTDYMMTWDLSSAFMLQTIPFTPNRTKFFRS